MPNKLVSSAVIKESGVAFGTSGARGLVTQFSSNVCAAFSVAFISAIKPFFSFKKVAIAVDNRPSSYAMAQACASALEQFGVDVVYYGVVPTPALAYVAQVHAMPAIMVTGSHIPFDRNGLKFYRPDGEISKSDEQVILNEIVEFIGIDKLPELVVNHQAAEEYITRYTSLFDSLWLTGKRIGIYEHSSAGRDLYYKIFEAFGAEVISLERSDQFVPIDTEAVSEEDTLKAIRWSEDYKLDLIFSTDGDGDRPLVSDENGHWLRGDILGLLTSDVLNIEALAVPVSCNTAIELCDRFSHVERTKIGSPYVIAEFSNLAGKYKSVAGFEANGGYLLGSDIDVNEHLLKALPTRDAMLPVIMLLIAAQKQPISELVNELPQRYTYSNRIQNFATNKSEALIVKGQSLPKELIKQIGFENLDVDSIDSTDGLRLMLSDGSVVHLRPSGNAPELRCYAEADNYHAAKNIVETTLDRIVKI
ncbi:phosphomannomutase [Aliivibrio fischeri]|uniref:phosphomannomutase n=1 Tax=Aliivibrio fischeri TaxID=668 RepID=UPI001F3EA267|nr:phosphomannomutase [Aliivibrio fischeri]MCE7556857.1 phosphomannomutase [Aliivibrio fischeri]MCE7563315.1 phosphomannomutase [Aliivibrio fischeri]MCE7570264.1 phosphomannomutase [Aliivibrio fischeri]